MNILRYVFNIMRVVLCVNFNLLKESLLKLLKKSEKFPETKPEQLRFNSKVSFNFNDTIIYQSCMRKECTNQVILNFNMKVVYACENKGIKCCYINYY